MKKIIFLAILLLVTVFLLLPQLQIPWMIVDDGESARASAELSDHFAKGNFAWLFKFEAQNGLLRPTYWLLQWVNFSLLGNNVYLHHFSHLLLFAIIAILIFLLTEVISGDSFAGLVAGLVFMYFGPAAENFYRLGTGEPVLVLVLLGTLYFLIKAVKSHSLFLFSLSLIFLVFSWFAKSTIIVFVPWSLFVIFLFFLFQEKDYPHAVRLSVVFLLGNLVLLVLVRLIMSAYQIEGGYGSQYQLDPRAILARLNFYLKMITKTYGPIIYLLLASFLWRLFSKLPVKKSKFLWQDKWELAMLGFFALLLAIQLPWPHLMGRYLPPALIGLSVVAGIESSFVLKQGIKLFGQRKHFLAGVLVVLLLALLIHPLLTNQQSITKMYQQVVPGETRRAKVVTYLAEIVPTNGRVFYNFSDGFVEFLYEMGLHFQIFYHRPDIQTAYLFLDNGFQFKRGDIIVTGPKYSYRYPWQQVRNILKNEQELKDIDDEWEIIEISKDETVLPNQFEKSYGPEKNLLSEDVFYFTDEEGTVKVPMNKVPIISGEASFVWKPPRDIMEIKKKIALIHQGGMVEPVPKGIFVWAGKDFLTYGIFDPWRNQWRVLTSQQEFSATGDYSVFLKWGKDGMILKTGTSYQFLPFYVGINPKEDIVLGPIEDNDFSEKSGRIYELYFSATPQN